MSRWLQWILAAVLLVSGIVHAEPVDVIDELRAMPAPSVRMKQVDAAARSAFDAALAEYDRQVEQNPYDIVERLQRCRFIDQFMSNYEYAGFIDDLAEVAERCRAKLIEQHPDHPEVALWQLERTFGEELLSEGAELLRKSGSGTWTAGQSARLYTALARAADVDDRRELALRYALKALELDETSDVRLIAAANLIAMGDKTRALQILTASVRDAQPKEGWSLSKKMDLLAQLGAHREVLELHAQLRDLSGYDHAEVARVLRTAGANDLARQELELATKGGGGQYSTDDERELFRFELELGSSEQALTAYQAWRDSGWMEDPFGVNRFALFVRDPLLPVQPRDLAGLFAFLGALGAIALICLVPIAGVHYRGLALRVRSGEPYLNDGWRLQHAWIALCCLGSASLLALYSAGAVDITGSNAGGWAIDGTDQQLAQIALMESLLTIALLLPFGVVAVALASVLRLPLLLAWHSRPESMQELALDDALWQMIGAVRDHYGVITALWIVAVAAPVVEEFVFRGVLLRSFASHIGAGWANIVQAALFSAMHMNLQAALVLFVLGLVLGTLARRSGSLLAPMLLHAAFNLIAALILL